MPCVKASGSWGRTESTFTASRWGASAGRAIKGGGACGSGAEAGRRSQNETTARISAAMMRIMGQRRMERTGLVGWRASVDRFKDFLRPTGGSFQEIVYTAFGGFAR